MIVSELIKQLKKYPAGCDVIFSAHDHDSMLLDEQETISCVFLNTIKHNDTLYKIVILKQ